MGLDLFNLLFNVVFEMIDEVYELSILACPFEYMGGT